VNGLRAAGSGNRLAWTVVKTFIVGLHMVRNDYSVRLAIWGAGLTAFLLLSGAAVLGHLNFTRWDAMEAFLPTIWYAHSEILAGRFPLWNPLQNLGEPLHALGLSGALYPPFTLAVALTKIANWEPARALDVIAIMHATFGAIGVAWLLLEVRVRPALAFVAGVSAMLSGFALIAGSMWVHVLPNLAWSVWALLGFRRVIFAEHGRSGVVIATVSLGAVFLTGHVQMAANVWLAVGLWAVGFAVVMGRLRAVVAPFALIIVAALLIVVAVVLPTALILDDTHRMAGAVTPGNSFRPYAMLGLIVPTIRTTDGALVHNALLTTFLGAWVLPAMLLGIGVLLHRRAGADAVQVRAFVVTSVIAVVCIWLNFGPSGGLYSLLHSLPIWSQFRVPYKYFERAVPLLAIAGALGLELAIRYTPHRIYQWAALLILGIGTTAWINAPATQPLAVAAFVAAVVTGLVIALLPIARVAWALVPLTIVQAVALIAITQGSTQSKAYIYDRNPDSRLVVPADGQRVLPLSHGAIGNAFIRPLGTYYTPSLDGYPSPSGQRFALTSRRLEAYFPTAVSGVPLRQPVNLSDFLKSNLLALAYVGHLVVYVRDSTVLRAVAATFPKAAVSRTPLTHIFHIDTPLARAYFPQQQVPGSAADAWDVLYGSASLRAASVEGDQRRRPLPPARVTALQWDRDRVNAEIEAPFGGLLVFSTSYSKEWKATVDGRGTPLVPVNGLFAGVWVPDDAKQVVLAIRQWPLYVGLVSALLGVLLAVIGGRLAFPHRSHL
jgi:hypothetical protein